MDNSRSNQLKLLLSMVIFGTIGIIRKYIPYPSSVIALARAWIGTVCLLVLFFPGKRKNDGLHKRAQKCDLLLLCLSGVLIGANWILLFEAYHYTSVAVATICYYMAPVIVIVASPFLLHEKLSLRCKLCVLTAVAGMVLVSGVLEIGSVGLNGALLGLGAAILYAIVVIINKQLTAFPAYERTVLQLGIAGIALLPYVLLTEEVTALQPDGKGLLLLLVAGLIHTALAYALYFDSITHVSAATVALFSYLDPIIAVLLSLFFLQESVTLPTGIGMFLVIGATAVSQLPEHNKTDKRRSPL